MLTSQLVGYAAAPHDSTSTGGLGIYHDASTRWQWLFKPVRGPDSPPVYPESTEGMGRAGLTRTERGGKGVVRL